MLSNLGSALLSGSPNLLGLSQILESQNPMVPPKMLAVSHLSDKPIGNDVFFPVVGGYGDFTNEQVETILR